MGQGGVQVLGRFSWCALFGDDDAAYFFQVDVVEVLTGEVESVGAFLRRFPGQGLGDVQVVQDADRVLVEGISLVEGQGGWEGEVPGAVGRRSQGEGVAGVGEVGAGEELVEVALGVEVAGGLGGFGTELFTGLRARAETELAPPVGADRGRGDEVPCGARSRWGCRGRRDGGRSCRVR